MPDEGIARLKLATPAGAVCRPKRGQRDVRPGQYGVAMTPPILRRPPDESPSPHSVSRRAFMTSVTAAAAVSAIGINLSNPSSASAAVTWGYPFKFRSGRSRGFTGQWPAGHAGVDYIPGAGTPIHAVADGNIFISGISGTDGAYGESVWIQHADGYRSIYAHMEYATRAPLGPVSRGQQIGKVGNTGKSYGAHLHIEIHRNGVALNPDPFIDAAPLASSNTPPLIPAKRDIEMRTIYNINGVDSDVFELRRRATVGEYTFQPLSFGAAAIEFQLWGAPENVTQAEWTSIKSIVNSRRVANGMPALP